MTARELKEININTRTGSKSEDNEPVLVFI
jgi:hypothetical protein